MHNDFGLIEVDMWVAGSEQTAAGTRLVKIREFPELVPAGLGSN